MNDRSDGDVADEDVVGGDFNGGCSRKSRRVTSGDVPNGELAPMDVLCGGGEKD